MEGSAIAGAESPFVGRTATLEVALVSSVAAVLVVTVAVARVVSVVPLSTVAVMLVVTVVLVSTVPTTVPVVTVVTVATVLVVTVMLVPVVPAAPVVLVPTGIEVAILIPVATKPRWRQPVPAATTSLAPLLVTRRVRSPLCENRRSLAHPHFVQRRSASVASDLAPRQDVDLFHPRRLAARDQDHVVALERHAFDARDQCGQRLERIVLAAASHLLIVRANLIQAFPHPSPPVNADRTAIPAVSFRPVACDALPSIL